MKYLKKKLALHLLLPMLLILTLPGCFRQIEYSKTITNDSESEITVTFTCCGQSEEKSFVIEPGATQVVHSCIYEGPGQVPDCNENPMDFQVFGTQGEQMDVDIQNSQSWDYRRDDKVINCNFTFSPSSVLTKSSN